MEMFCVENGFGKSLSMSRLWAAYCLVGFVFSEVYGEIGPSDEAPVPTIGFPSL